jgi:hypothetical protein
LRPPHASLPRQPESHALRHEVRSVVIAKWPLEAVKFVKCSVPGFVFSSAPRRQAILSWLRTTGCFWIVLLRATLAMMNSRRG